MNLNELIAEVTNSSAFVRGLAIHDLVTEISRRMEELHLSRTDLAKRMGVSPAYITKILYGNANFTLETIAKLAHALDAEIAISFTPKPGAGSVAVVPEAVVPTSGTKARGRKQDLVAPRERKARKALPTA